jgi:hypothetical protein
VIAIAPGVDHTEAERAAAIGFGHPPAGSDSVRYTLHDLSSPETAVVTKPFKVVD